MSKKLRIGNAQGFWGDSPGAPASLVQQQPDLDYLTLDYLAEVSLSIMAVQKEKDPSAGFARDFLDVVRSLKEIGSSTRIITNAGGLNPMACAKACKTIAPQAKIAVVTGDDVLPLVLQEKTPIPAVNLATANAYLGAKQIVEALEQGADIVITGRVADPSLTVAPCVVHYGWKWDDYDRLAGATIAGHLIECGTQVTGGISTNWLQLSDHKRIGFPIAEVEEDGSCVITKPFNTGGVVNEQTVKEQLLYEIGDPANYLSPDVAVSFLSLQLNNDGVDRVRVSEAKGKPPPSTYKVSATYRDGYKAEAILALVGPDVVQKGRMCGEIIRERVRGKGYDLARFHVECLGSGDLAPGVVERPVHLPECVLRMCAIDPSRQALEVFAKEVASLVTSGPQGTTGYTTGRPKVRPVFAFRPHLIQANMVEPKMEIIR